MEAVKIIMICLIGTMFILLLNKQNKEYGIYISIAVGIIVFFLVVNKIKIIIDVIYRISGFINIDDIYVKILFQILGLAFITEFGAGLCKDAGQNSIANNIELAGKIMILVTSMPIILSIVELIEELI
jgi:stage III sporulation protein AD